MAEPDGTADIEDAEDNVLLDDDDEAEAVGEGESEDAEPPRRRVSELLEGQDELGESASDLQLVATPIHAEPTESGQAVYQLDLSGDEPEGTLLEPEGGQDAQVRTSAGLPAGAATPTPITTAEDAHSAVRELIGQRDRLVMAAERDGVNAYELASGIDAFVEAVIGSVRHYDEND